MAAVGDVTAVDLSHRGATYNALGRHEDALADLASEISPEAPLFVNKHDLSMVHGCELRHLTEKETPFEWSPPLARGTIAHKAIELSMHQRRRPIPLELVDSHRVAFFVQRHQSRLHLQSIR